MLSATSKIKGVENGTPLSKLEQFSGYSADPAL